MNIILYGIPADTAELIAGRYDLELIHSIEEIGTCYGREIQMYKRV